MRHQVKIFILNYSFVRLACNAPSGFCGSDVFAEIHHLRDSRDDKSMFAIHIGINRFGFLLPEGYQLFAVCCHAGPVNPVR